MRSLKEDKGVELYPDKEGNIVAKSIGDKPKSSITTNKLSKMGVADSTRNLTPTETKTVDAVEKILKSKGKLKDITQKFNINPRPDLTFTRPEGDVLVTPDNGKTPYKISGDAIDKMLKNENFKKGYDACISGKPIAIKESRDWLTGYGAASKDLKILKERKMVPGEIDDADDYIAVIRSKGLEATLGEMVSKRTIVYTPIIISIIPGVEARLRIFSQGNYTLFDDNGGWEGLDHFEFEKDLDELLAAYA